MANRTCSWPGCDIVVEPAHWGCAMHWYALPQEIRDRLVAAYTPGQAGNFREASDEYWAAFQEAREWIEQNRGLIR
jgi:hypothetical protein